MQSSMYQAFGLILKSEIILPELIVQESNKPADVQIVVCDLTKPQSMLESPEAFVQVEDSGVWFHVQGIAIYQICNGNEIRVSPYSGAKQDQVRLFLLGTCMGILLQQRRILPLHGSAIVMDGKAYAIVGHSGAGKSTLATALMRRGYPMLSDDVIPVKLTEAQHPLVAPAYPQQKLWKKSLDAFDVATNDLHPIVKREDKFIVPVKAAFYDQPIVLGGVFELTCHDHQGLECAPAVGLEKLRILTEHTYRHFLVGQLDRTAWHFQMAATIAGKIKMYQMNRPAEPFTANELAEMLLDTMKQKEMTI